MYLCMQFLYGPKILRTNHQWPRCRVPMALQECPATKYREGCCTPVEPSGRSSGGTGDWSAESSGRRGTAYSLLQKKTFRLIPVLLVAGVLVDFRSVDHRHCLRKILENRCTVIEIMPFVNSAALLYLDLVIIASNCIAFRHPH